MPRRPIDPSTFTFDDEALSKISRKELGNYLELLKDMYAQRGKKYEKAKSIIRRNKTAIKAKSVNTDLIPKPPGRRSRDFNVFVAMQADGEVDLDKNTYKNLIGTIQTSIRASNMDIELPYKDQAQEEIVLVIASIKEQYPFIKKYRGAWPVIILMRQFLNNHRGHTRAQARIAANAAAAANAGPAAAGPAPVAPGPVGGGNDDDNDDEGEGSDVVISDVDDD